MSRDIRFSMNTGAGGGEDIIQRMAEPMIRKSAEFIADRANRISPAIRTTPQTFEVSESMIGMPNRKGGQRVYVEVKAKNRVGGDAYYNDYQTLRLALDAGRITKSAWDKM